MGPTILPLVEMSSISRSFGCIGVFQGELNPLSSRSVVDTCVMPVLLFGSESWYLTDTPLKSWRTFSVPLARGFLDCPVFTPTQVD